VHGEACSIGAVRVRLAGAGEGILGWSLRDATSTEIDGLPTERSDESPPATQAHPNGALSIDHVVVMTPNLDRTVAAVQAAGAELRRIREGEAVGHQVRQGFFRFGETLLEVVAPADGDAGGKEPARFWGLTVTVGDIDAAADLLGDRLGEVRDAVQPGRRIATVRRSAGLSVPLALISPEPPKGV
jgi:hypothetical protein